MHSGTNYLLDLQDFMLMAQSADEVSTYVAGSNHYYFHILAVTQFLVESICLCVRVPTAFSQD